MNLAGGPATGKGNVVERPAEPGQFLEAVFFRTLADDNYLEIRMRLPQ